MSKASSSFDRDAAILEALVREREAARFRDAAAALLKRHRRAHPDAVFVVCDGYRRLGLLEQAYHLVGLDEPLRRRVPTSEFEGRRVLWAARLLNLMGATEFALQLLEQVELVTFDDYRHAGTIHLTQFDFSGGLKLFERMAKLDPDPGSYASRLARLGLADALSGLGEMDRAVEVARAVAASARGPEERLLRGIGLQAQGEYLARGGRVTRALPVLREAAGHFKPDDRSTDHAFLLKWLGFALAKSGKPEEGGPMLERAFGILNRNRFRPESWLDVIRLRAECGLASEEERKTMLSYPGLAPGFRAMLKGPGGEDAVSRGKAGLRIDLARDEFWEGLRPRSGVPIDLRALAFVALAGDWGISTVRLKSLLWPDEAYSFLQLDNRLRQLFHRLRRSRGVAIASLDGLARISRKDAARLRIASGELVPPSFLERHASFSREDVERHYCLSRTQAMARVTEWSARGWVSRAREGRAIRYKVRTRRQT
jgi:tetratricopeptide (TPR) repeat protein